MDVRKDRKVKSQNLSGKVRLSLALLSTKIRKDYPNSVFLRLKYLLEGKGNTIFTNPLIPPFLDLQCFRY